MANQWLDPDLIQQHSLDMRQFIDFRESTLPNGMRIIDAHNSSGLHFTVLPDRGLDIWSAHYKGIPLTWIAPGSPHPPDFGQPWLSLFNGGLLTTCGLTHVGPPEDGRDLHGDYTRLRAASTRLDGATDPQSGAYVLNLHGAVKQSRLFGEQLDVRRDFFLYLGQPEIVIVDTVTNVSDEPAPFMLLYHCNLGYPLVREGSEFVLASGVYPRDAAAQAGIETWNHYEAATAGYQEQVFFHHARLSAAQAGKGAQAALLNDDMGLRLAWDTTHAPYLTQWKNTRQGIYVCGIEPGNCIPEGQNAARESGRLVLLQPGETQTFRLRLEVLDGLDAVQQCRAEMEVIQQQGIPVTGCNWTGYEPYNQ